VARLKVGSSMPTRLDHTIFNERAESQDKIKAIKEIDASLLQGLMTASKEIYNNLINGISLEQNIPIDSGTPCKQSYDLYYIDFQNPENNIWQVNTQLHNETSH